jgi:DNA-binding MarR family transcriptional regulator
MIEANKDGFAEGDAHHATRRLRELVQLSRAFERRLEKELDVNPTDREAMEHLISRGPLSAKDLARAIGHSPGGTTSVIDRLEKSGHAERHPDPNDRRATLVFATSASREKAESILWEMVRAVDAVATSLPAHEQGIVSRYLADVVSVYRVVSDSSDPG